MTYKIFIDGEAGTTGLEIKKRISGQDDLTILSIDDHLRKDKAERLKFFNMADLVFLCLPDEESKMIVEQASENTKIIDASTAFRTDENWAYGLSELDSNQSEIIHSSNRVSNPGCHATGFILLTNPIIDEGIIHKNTFLSAHSVTGYSGGGKKMIGKYEGENKETRDSLVSPGQYGLTQNHKHIPEMTIHSGLDVKPVFTPIVSNYYRGMLVSIPVDTSQLRRQLDLEDMISLYKQRYESSKLISVKSEKEAAQDGFIYADRLREKDSLEIIVCGNNERMTLMARYDNLGKGASGAAIQNMNIMLGRPEYTGLNL